MFFKLGTDNITALTCFTASASTYGRLWHQAYLFVFSFTAKRDQVFVGGCFSHDEQSAGLCGRREGYWGIHVTRLLISGHQT